MTKEEAANLVPGTQVTYYSDDAIFIKYWEQDGLALITFGDEVERHYENVDPHWLKTK